MDLQVEKRELFRLLAKVQGVVERKSALPVLANVHLEAHDAGLTLSATDMYLSLTGTVRAEVRQAGSVAVSARDLFERVKTMPEGAIQVQTAAGASVAVKSLTSARRFTLRGMPGEDFPPMPKPSEGAPTLSVSGSVLASLIQKTHYAVSSDETRAHLNSALVEWEGSTLRMVSTDGHRLSKMEIASAGKEASATMLIPLKAIGELRRLCEDVVSDSPGEGLSVTQSGSSAFFHVGKSASVGSLTFGVKLVDAQFPPYAQVIPQHLDKQLRVSRVAFADALRAVSVASSERTGGIRLSVSPGKMVVFTESAESGDAHDELPIDYSGAPVQIGFNAKYFLDVLSCLDEAEVLLYLGGELDPAVVRSGDGAGFLAVIMPMRI